MNAFSYEEPPIHIQNHIQQLIKQFFNETSKKIEKVHVRKQVYKVTTQSKNYRVDLIKNLKITDGQQSAFDNGIHVPKVFIISNRHKISEWIDGELCLDIWKDPIKGEIVARKLGEEVAKINLIKKDNLFLIHNELNLGNYVLTKNNDLYIVDVEEFKFVNDVIQSIVKLLLKRIRRKDRIDIILEEYQKINKETNIEEILKICKNKDWKWIKK